MVRTSTTNSSPWHGGADRVDSDALAAIGGVARRDVQIGLLPDCSRRQLKVRVAGKQRFATATVLARYNPVVRALAVHYAQAASLLVELLRHQAGKLSLLCQIFSGEGYQWGALQQCSRVPPHRRRSLQARYWYPSQALQKDAIHGHHRTLISQAIAG